MFSGIIETIATVKSVVTKGGSIDITMRCSFTHELKIDQSVAHNGVCLTVVAIDGDCYTVTAIDETLRRSNLSELTLGTEVNVERSMRMNSMLDGHIVQGHVDTTAKCTNVEQVDGGSWLYTFEYLPQSTAGYLTVEKGSVTVNGVSLTVCNSKENSFGVAIIPYTYQNTNFHNFVPGSIVNLEFDIIGKYIAKMLPRQ